MTEEHKEVLRAQLRTKGTRNPADMELYELSQLSGITMDPHVFEILLDLLRKNVTPDAIVEMLRSMCIPAYQRLHNQRDGNHHSSSLSSTTQSGAAATSSHSALALSSGALKADHSLARNSSHSVPTSRQSSSRKKYTHR